MRVIATQHTVLRETDMEIWFHLSVMPPDPCCSCPSLPVGGCVIARAFLASLPRSWLLCCAVVPCLLFVSLGWEREKYIYRRDFFAWRILLMKKKRISNCAGFFEKMHPDLQRIFEKQILPWITELSECVRNGGTVSLVAVDNLERVLRDVYFQSQDQVPCNSDRPR